MPEQKFIIRIGGESRDFTRTVGRVKRNLDGLKRAVFSIQGALGGLGAALSFRAIIRATERQQQAMRQLEQRIDSTGGAAGKTAKELAAFAGELQKMTTFGDEAIIEMQSLLLTFTNIAGPQFDRATEAVLDMSVAMGQDLSASVKQVGRALDDPVRNLGALSRAGITLDDEQRKLIKTLVETGRTAEAQGIILDKLNKKFGGAAKTATDTLGGELGQLGNAFADLLEADGGGMNDAISATKELTALMQDPGTVAGFNTMTRSVIQLVGVLARAVTGLAALVEGIKIAVTQSSGFGEKYDELTKEIGKTERALAQAIKNRDRAHERNRAKYEGEVDALRIVLHNLKAARDELFDTPKIKQPKPGDEPHTANGIPAPIATPTGTPTPAATGPTGFGAALEQAVARQSEAAAQMREEMQRSADAVRDMLDPTRALNRELERNRELYEAGYLGAEDYAHAQQEVQRRIAETRGGFEEISIAIAETGGQLNQFGVQAARNIQSSLADFLFDPFEQGLSGMADSLQRTLTRMAADIVAAQLAKKLFGDFGGGGEGEGVGGIAGGIFGAGKKILAGLFHSGGIVGGGGPGRAGPALAFAGAPRFAAGGEVPAILHRGEEVLTATDPRHRRNGGGGINVTNNFTIQGEVSRATQEQIAARIGESVNRAMRRNR